MQHPFGRLASVRRLVWAALAAPAILSLTIACNDSPLDPSAPSAIDLTPNASLTGALSGATVSLSPQLISSKCVTVNGDISKAGTATVLKTCVGATTQKFVWTTDGHLKVGTLCVVDGSGKGRDLDPAVLWTCSNETYQKWAPTSTGEIKGINGKCLDVTGSNTADGTPIILYTCHGGSNQTWSTTGGSTSTPTTSTPTTTSPTSPPSSTTSTSPTAPSGSIILTAGQSIQSAVDAHAAGATFYLKAGTYHQQSVIPKDGMTFIGETGAILDGDNTTAKAFSGKASHVTINHLVVQHYNSALSSGAIQGDWNVSTGWVVENCEVRENHAAGVYITDNIIVRNNFIHNNGQIGILGKGNGAYLTGNEVSYNNTGGNNIDWEAGGMKFLESSGVQFVKNYVHNNYGPGIWFDSNNQNAVIDGNRVENNTGAGIFYEISYGAIIRNNTVTANGGTGSIARAGILVSASPNVQVYSNTLSGNSNGIVGLQADRSSSRALYGPFLVQNLSVHDNTVTASRGVTGLVDQMGDGGIFTRNNHYAHDTYYQSSLSKPFIARGGSLTTLQWKAAGYDLTGIFN